MFEEKYAHLAAISQDAMPSCDFTGVTPVRDWVKFGSGLEPKPGKPVGVVKMAKYVRRGNKRAYPEVRNQKGDVIVPLIRVLDELAKVRDVSEVGLPATDGVIYMSAKSPLYAAILADMKTQHGPSWGSYQKSQKKCWLNMAERLVGRELNLGRTPTVIGPGVLARCVNPGDVFRKLLPAKPNGWPVSLFGDNGEFHKGLLVFVEHKHMKPGVFYSNAQNYKLRIRAGWLDKYSKSSFVILKSAASQPSLTGLTNQYIVQTELYYRLNPGPQGWEEALLKGIENSFIHNREEFVTKVDEAADFEDDELDTTVGLEVLCKWARQESKPVFMARLHNARIERAARRIARLNAGRYYSACQMEDPFGVLRAGEVTVWNGFVIVPNRAKTRWNTSAWDGGSDFDGDTLRLTEEVNIVKLGADIQRTPYPLIGEKINPEDAGTDEVMKEFPITSEEKFLREVVALGKKQLDLPSIGEAANLMSGYCVRRMDDAQNYIAAIRTLANVCQGRVDGKTPSVGDMTHYKKIADFIRGRKYKGVVTQVGSPAWYTLIKPGKSGLRFDEARTKPVVTETAIDYLGKLVSEELKAQAPRMVSEPDFPYEQLPPAEIALREKYYGITASYKADMEAANREDSRTMREAAISKHRALFNERISPVMKSGAVDAGRFFRHLYTHSKKKTWGGQQGDRLYYYIGGDSVEEGFRGAPYGLRCPPTPAGEPEKVFHKMELFTLAKDWILATYAKFEEAAASSDDDDGDEPPPTTPGKGVQEPPKAQGFMGYRGGYAPGGKGSASGDGKDHAMREVANAFVGELASKRPSSTLTSASLIAAKFSNYQPLITGPLYESVTGPGVTLVQVTPEALKDAPEVIVMLARNGKLKGQPLVGSTLETIRAFYNYGKRTGKPVRFVVGDMPGVDEEFIVELQHLGASFEIYHTGESSRLKAR